MSIQSLQQINNPAVPPVLVLRKAARLRQKLEAILRAKRGLTVLGRNKTVVALATQLGLEDHDFCHFEIVLDRRCLSLVCIPQSHWNRADMMEHFEELRIAAGALGHKIILAPESLIRKTHPSGADTGVNSVACEVSGSDRTTILHFLLENGSGTLAQLAGLISNPDPVGAVLHLAVTGAVDIDLDASIACATKVRFPVRVH